MNEVATIKKLQTAINLKGYKLLYSTHEFYSVKYERPIVMYIISQAQVDDENVFNIQLFKSASKIRVIFFLRDIYNYIKNGVDFDKAVKSSVDNQKEYLTKHDYIEKREKVGR